LVFSTFAGGMVHSNKDEINHVFKWFDKQLINNICPTCLSDATCPYKLELLKNLNIADKRRTSK
jgi:hypothetical protein